MKYPKGMVGPLGSGGGMLAGTAGWLLAIPSAAGGVGLWLLAAAADLQWRVAGLAAWLRGMDPSAIAFRFA